MKLVPCESSEEKNMEDFFNSSVVQGTMDYRLERKKGFSEFYKLFGEDHKTYLFKDSESNIKAMASFAFKKAFIHHQEQKVGYITDLRLSPGLGPDWTQEFAKILKKEKKENNCSHVFSTLEEYEGLLYNSLLRVQHRTQPFTCYHLFRKFFLVLLVGKKPWRKKTLTHIKISMGTMEDVEPVCQYLRRRSVGKILLQDLSPQELQRRIETWPLFSMENFIIARNKKGHIIGCMAPWNTAEVQQIICHKYKGKSFNAYTALKPLSLLGLTRFLPKEGQALELKFLTHWACDNPDIFYALLDEAFNLSQKDEILTYLNYMGDYHTRPPQAFFNLKIPFGLYTLLDHTEKLPPFLHPNPFSPPPDFSFTHF